MNGEKKFWDLQKNIALTYEDSYYQRSASGGVDFISLFSQSAGNFRLFYEGGVGGGFMDAGQVSKPAGQGSLQITPSVSTYNESQEIEEGHLYILKTLTLGYFALYVDDLQYINGKPQVNFTLYKVNGASDKDSPQPQPQPQPGEPGEPPSQAAGVEIYLQVGNTVARVNGALVKIPAPKMVGDRVMVPLRFIGEAMGVRVDWIEREQKVTYSSNIINIELWEGRANARVNGNLVAMDPAPMLIDDTTFVPLRFVSEKLGAEVNWDHASQSATIRYNPGGQTEVQPGPATPPVAQPGPVTPPAAPEPARQTVQGAFTSSGNMHLSRSLHTATLLSSGKVLIASGNYDNDYIDDAELYDPATGSSTVIQMNSSERWGPTGTRLSDDTVLIAGGTNDFAELFDPKKNNSFTRTGMMRFPSRDLVATPLPGDKVLFTGGGEDHTAEIYDHKSGQFKYFADGFHYIPNM